MQRTALSPESIHEAEQRRKEREEKRLILSVVIGLLSFFPPLFLLPYIIDFLRRKDYSKIPVKKVFDKRRLWSFSFLLTSYSLSYFLIFPFYASLKRNILPFWKPFFSYPFSEFLVYPHFSLYNNLYLFILYGLVVPIVISIPLAVVLKKKYRLRIPPDSLVIPTKQGNIVIEKYNTGIMVVGAPGSGKTELIKQVIYQFPHKRDYVWVIFDPKGDYYEAFGTEKDITLSVNGSSYAWNIFWEIDPDRATTDVIEIAKEIFPIEERGGEDKFWVVTSQQLLSAFILTFYRQALQTYTKYFSGKVDRERLKEFLPTNEDFMDFINQLTIEQAYNLLVNQEDLRSVAEYINPQAMKQASGVWSNFYSRINEIFIGDFYKTAGKRQMSIRDYIENPQGRKLFIEYNVETGEAVAPIFRLLVDRAIKYSFARENQYNRIGEPRKKYFVIDEFQLIPKLKRYQELVNFGRSYYITSIIGIQSIAQVIEKYGKDSANAVVAGHAYLFALRAYDSASSQLIRSRIGKKQVWQREPQHIQVQGRGVYVADKYSTTEYFPISEEHLRTMPVGQCIIVTPDGFREVNLYTFKEGRKIIKEILIL
ncbi:hypothetical protein ABOONEI_2719 [Aciduliprofundum boonei T469]|nr:hypothetical protein ABOONEI_2719 [Aciduliprofundum boonei T469]